MNESSIKRPTRRGFLENAVALTGVIPLMPRLVMRNLSLFSAASTKTAAVAETPRIDRASPYRSLNRDEAAFTEAMVSVLCPADHLTPDGVTCGLVIVMDRKLTNEVGTGVRDFKAGIAAANRACQERFGVRFDQLSAPEAGGFLRDIAADRVRADVSLASWLNERVNPLLMQACFAGPIYDGYCNKVFWKIFGHPGKPTTYRT